MGLLEMDARSVLTSKTDGDPEEIEAIVTGLRGYRMEHEAAAKLYDGSTAPSPLPAAAGLSSCLCHNIAGMHVPKVACSVDAQTTAPRISELALAGPASVHITAVKAVAPSSVPDSVQHTPAPDSVQHTPAPATTANLPIPAESGASWKDTARAAGVLALSLVLLRALA